jgi:hypothetical protein
MRIVYALENCELPNTRCYTYKSRKQFSVINVNEDCNEELMDEDKEPVGLRNESTARTVNRSIFPEIFDE